MKNNYREDWEIRTENDCEVIVLKELEKMGFDVSKNGWPDFIAVNWEKKEVRFIEVKPANKKLKPRQLKMKRIFELLGLRYELWKVGNGRVVYKG